MKAAQLRQSILQAAVQGKLVPQNVHDEPASELLARIRQEKVRLLKEGKIKKEKPLPPIAADEIPYDLPDGWVWCRLSELVSLYDGSIRRGPFGSAIRKDMFVPYTGMEYKIYEQGNAIRKTIDYGTYYISEEHYNKLKSFSVVPGDIIISCAGTLGETFIIPECAPKGIINQALLKLNINSHIMSNDFFLLMFKAIIQHQIVLSSLGSAMKNLTSIVWLKESVVFPLPPLAEQQRIVAKVDELMALCDELEAAEKELDALETRFAEYLPKSILQAAVQGKLVPQNVHDEPASELLMRIRQEKARLVKEGRIQKEKPLPPIAENEIQYDLPYGWVWCRLGEVCNTVMGQSPDGYSVFDAEDGDSSIEFHQGKSYFTDMYLERSPKMTYLPTKIAQGGDVLLAVRAPVGAVNITQREICIGRGLCALQILSGVDSRFLFYFLKPMEAYFNEKATGTTFIAISADIVKNALFPLPPLAEQQRIVEKVDELMALCDELKAAKEIPVKTDVAQILPFPHAENDVVEYDIDIAARGDGEELPPEAIADLAKLFGVDKNA